MCAMMSSLNSGNFTVKNYTELIMGLRRRNGELVYAFTLSMRHSFFKISMFYRAFFNSIIDNHQYMHFFTFKTVLV